MENKKHQFKVEFKRKGVENPDYKDIKTIDDLFKLANSLNKKDTKKMLKELGTAFEIYKIMNNVDPDKPPIDMECWQWAND